MQLLAPVDIYCERLDAGFWAEPINAISNAAFFIAAILLYRLQKKSPANPNFYRENMSVIGLLALVGFGSTIFHTFGNVIGMIADVAGIMIFVHTYLYICVRRMLGWGRGKSAIFIAVFFAILMLMDNIPKKFSVNGSEAYLPCLLVILWMWQQTRARSLKYSQLYLKAGIIFIISLFFRTIDMASCQMLPIGTHMMWHVLNGVVLYLLTKALIHSSEKR